MSKRKTVKKRFLVEIEVDEEKVAKEWNDYSINYSNGEELINSRMIDFIYEGDCDMSKDGMKEWGYAKRIIKEIK